MKKNYSQIFMKAKDFGTQERIKNAEWIIEYGMWVPEMLGQFSDREK